MPQKSDNETIDALRSFLPERRLIRAGDVDALDLKYEAQTTDSFSARLMILLGIEFDMYDKGGRDVDFKGLTLEIGSESPIAGSDPTSDMVLQHGSTEAMMLHVDDRKGFLHLRKRFSKIGRYILKHEDTLAIPYVMGVTYSEMARVGVALGMRQLDIHEIDNEYQASIRARHAVTFAGSKRPRVFRPAAVYLPTDEFVERFTKPSDSR